MGTEGVLTFSPGESRKTIDVKILDDELYEKAEVSPLREHAACRSHAPAPVGLAGRAV